MSLHELQKSIIESSFFSRMQAIQACSYIPMKLESVRKSHIVSWNNEILSFCNVNRLRESKARENM